MKNKLNMVSLLVTTMKIQENTVNNFGTTVSVFVFLKHTL